MLLPNASREELRQYFSGFGAKSLNLPFPRPKEGFLGLSK
ncbi:hypothetical protein NSTC731_04061 [Nostoc sp. DSM 114167]